MRLRRARVQNFRSIKDSGWFEVDDLKTILVGPNEGGKTALLRALEQLNPGRLSRPFEPLRDFPRSEYHRISTGEVDPATTVVVEAEYDLDVNERAALADISPQFGEVSYYRAVRLDNSVLEALVHAPPWPTIGVLKSSLRQVAAHVDARRRDEFEHSQRGAAEPLEDILAVWPDDHALQGPDAALLDRWLDTAIAPLVDQENETEMSRLAMLREAIRTVSAHTQVVETLRSWLPVMVYVSTYPAVTPLLHLGHLADAMDAGAVDETDAYNFGNFCLLNLLGFSARELSELGRPVEPAPGDTSAFERYRRQLDERDTRLNAASLRLTQHIKEVWNPVNADERPDYTIRITADQQYLKVVVEDSLGVQVELDQRSQGFKWLVSFFVVFFAQATDRAGKAILLLDEPGLSLHGLKQREFRTTLSKLGESNQLLFTTHSPFLIGPDELPLVRVVEMVDRATGTSVSAELAARDPASMLPLQEAVAYELATQLFSGEPKLLFESLTDYWYVSATAWLLSQAGMAQLDLAIQLMPAGSAASVVYFGTILQAQELRVAALLDEDTRTDRAELQDRLVQLLGHKRVVRTKDVYDGPVATPQVEDLLRDTLAQLAKDVFGWELGDPTELGTWGSRPLTEILTDKVGPDFSREKLAMAYLHWARDRQASSLSSDERIQWMRFLEHLDQALE